MKATKQHCYAVRILRVYSRQESKLTIDNLLLQHTHLIVDKAVLLNHRTQPYQLFADLLESLCAHQRLGFAQWSLNRYLGQVMLSLQRRQPCAVELVPEPYTIVMLLGVVLRKFWYRQLAFALLERGWNTRTKIFCIAKQIL